jgi:hypothetical protein
MTEITDLLVTEEEGAATRRLALLGRIGGRWRLLASVALPVELPRAAAEEALEARVDEAAASAGWGGISRRWASLSRLVARTGPPGNLAVVGVTPDETDRLAELASAAGWRPRAASLARDGALGVAETLLAPEARAALVGTGDPPSGEERRGLGLLAALAEATSRRRPELTVVAAGAVADLLRSSGRWAEASGGGSPAAADPGAADADGTAAASTAAAGTTAPGAGDPGGGGEAGATAPGDSKAASLAPSGILVAPAAGRGDPPGTPLHRFLASLAAPPGDGRRLVAEALATLARLLARRLEVLDVGASAGTWILAEPDGSPPRWTVVARGALVPPPVDDGLVEEVLAWSVVDLDRGRLRDRLWELEADPWADGGVEGGLLRLAAARAALGRLLAAGSHLVGGPPPDLTIVAGGPWAPVPAPAVALAVADVLRRPAAAQLAWDHAHLLAPLGAVGDEVTRREILVDLLDDLLVPLGTVVSPGLLAGSRSRGRVVVRGSGGETALDLVPGALQLVDLPPGEVAEADLQFHQPVLLGRVGRRFQLRVAGGLSGLLFDLRGVPMALPERLDRRRQLLAAWQGAFWMGWQGDG